MPTPADLARQAEGFSDRQWYEFLDEVDEVSRRRRQGAQAAAAPVGASRDDIARWVAQRHFIADSGIRQIWYLPGDAPDDEIRFVEVNERLGGNPNRVEAIDFGLNIDGVNLRLFVADVTVDQLDIIRRDPTCLPSGWSLDGNVVWSRSG